MQKQQPILCQRGTTLPTPEFVRACEQSLLLSLAQRGLLQTRQLEECLSMLTACRGDAPIVRRKGGA